MNFIKNSTRDFTRKPQGISKTLLIMLMMMMMPMMMIMMMMVMVMVGQHHSRQPTCCHVCI
jgi:hypothetical protein